MGERARSCLYCTKHKHRQLSLVGVLAGNSELVLQSCWVLRRRAANGQYAQQHSMIQRAWTLDVTAAANPRQPLRPWLGRGYMQETKLDGMHSTACAGRCMQAALGCS